jgi:hypothetical protein
MAEEKLSNEEPMIRAMLGAKMFDAGQHLAEVSASINAMRLHMILGDKARFGVKLDEARYSLRQLKSTLDMIEFEQRHYK